MRVALYARVSSEMQIETDTPIEGQLRELREHCERQGWSVVEEYVDRAKSGGSDDREAFQQMIADAKRKPKPFDSILVWKFSRFARNQDDSLMYKGVLRKRCKVDVISLKEPIPEGASGRLLEGMLELLDQFYVDNLKSDIMRGSRQVASQGYSAGGFPPYGYRRVSVEAGQKRNGTARTRTRWEVDPDTAPRMLAAFRAAADGSSLRQILEASGVPMSESGISTALRNRAYLGERTYNVWHVKRGQEREWALEEHEAIRTMNPADQWVVTPDAHEAVVTPALFEAANASLTSRRQAFMIEKHRDSQYRLRGLAWCGYCGSRRLVGQRSGRDGWVYYYRCLNHRRGSDACPLVALKREALEGIVVEAIKERLLQPDAVAELVRMANAQREADRPQIEADLERLGREKAALKRELDNLVGSFAANPSLKGISQDFIDTHLDRMGRIDAERALLTADLAASDPVAIDEAAIRRELGYLDEFLFQDVEQDRRIFAMYVAAVRLFNDRVEVDLRWSMPTGEQESVSRSRETPAGHGPRCGDRCAHDWYRESGTPDVRIEHTVSVPRKHPRGLVLA